MNTTELTELMRGATDGLEPPPDFVSQVLQGGRRRRLRRRVATMASAVVVVVTAVVAGLVVALPGAQPVPIVDERLTAPTKGDLATDQAFLDEVATVWRNDLSIAHEAATGVYDHRLGDPHVYWAGNTPAGRAAIVLQQVEVQDNGQVPTSETGTRTAEGLVAIDPVDGVLKLVSTRVPGEPELGMAVFYNFGPGNQTMLIVDEGKPLYYSLHYAFQYFGGNTTPDVEWHPVQPSDGVAFVSITFPANPQAAVAYQGDSPPATVDWAKIKGDFHVKRVAIASEYLGLRLTDPSFRTSLLPWQETWDVGTPLDLSSAERDRLRGRHDPWVLGGGPGYEGMWAIYVGLPDGRRVVLKEIQSQNGTPQLFVITWLTAETSSPAEVGPVDRNAVLPVKYHIPDNGWIVAQRGQSLSYRTTPDGQWQDAGRDAALLPDDAVEVKVGDQVVPL